jgi:hypothetical protein
MSQISHNTIKQVHNSFHFDILDLTFTRRHTIGISIKANSTLEIPPGIANYKLSKTFILMNMAFLDKVFLIVLFLLQEMQ